jgi:hypothetical protein
MYNGQPESKEELFEWIRVRREVATALASGLLASDVQNQRPLAGLIDQAVEAADLLIKRLNR